MKRQNNKMPFVWTKDVSEYLKMASKDMLVIELGLIIYSIGTALFYVAGLGSHPMATFCDGLHISLNVSYGMANLIANLILLSALFVVGRKYINLGTVLCVFTTGPWINLFTDLLLRLKIAEHGISLRVLSAVLGTVLMGGGLGLYVAADRGFGAVEGLIKVLCSKCQWVSFTMAKIMQDILFVASGVLLGARWGFGTAFAVLFTGPILQASIQLFTRLLTNRRAE